MAILLNLKKKNLDVRCCSIETVDDNLPPVSSDLHFVGFSCIYDLVVWKLSYVLCMMVSRRC